VWLRLERGKKTGRDPEVERLEKGPNWEGRETKEYALWYNLTWSVYNARDIYHEKLLVNAPSAPNRAKQKVGERKGRQRFRLAHNLECVGTVVV